MLLSSCDTVGSGFGNDVRGLVHPGELTLGLSYAPNDRGSGYTMLPSYTCQAHKLAITSNSLT